MSAKCVSWVLCGVLAVLGTGCLPPPKASVKKNTVPPGTVIMAFTKKVRGPVELTLDGTRVPVQPRAKSRKAKRLVITGVTPGQHRYMLASLRDAFGPDQDTFVMEANQGVMLKLFAQEFKAVMYGQTESLPPAPQSLPGVSAKLE